MSVHGEIERIKQNIANTYAVLETLGCTMPEERTSDNLATTVGTSKWVILESPNGTRYKISVKDEEVKLLAEKITVAPKSMAAGFFTFLSNAFNASNCVFSLSVYCVRIFCTINSFSF